MTTDPRAPTDDLRRIPGVGPSIAADLRRLGVDVRKVPEQVREEWARSLADWPRQKAKELDAQGLPATQVLELTLAAAEKHGHKWPVRYVVK